MCDACNDPNFSADGYFEQLRQGLRDRRFLVQSVSGSRDSAEFSYTIGLTAHGLPELIVTGRRHDEATKLLTGWGDYVLDTSLVLPGETLETGPFRLEAVEVERPEKHLLMADSLYGSAVRALQLVWADDSGRWPWHPGHRARRSGQPVLGQRAPWYCPEHRPDRLEDPPYLDQAP